MAVAGTARAQTIKVLLNEGQKAVAVVCNGPVHLKNTAGERLDAPGMGTKVQLTAKAPNLLVGARPVAPPLVAGCADNRVRVGDDWWRGRLKVLVVNDAVMVINEVDLEDYLLSVVPSEMPSAWPMEALKAQAVAARSYVMNSLGQYPGMPYDVQRGQEDQVYLGIKQESGRTSQAVKATAGKVMVYGGRQFVRAFFHSTSGGVTGESTGIWHENLPYTRPVESPSEQSKHASWTAEIGHGDLERALLDIGFQVRELKAVLPHTQDEGGRHLTFSVVDRYGVRTISAFDLRRAVGRAEMKSTLFDMVWIGRENKIIEPKDLQGYLYGEVQLPDVRRYVFKGRGWGHGVGMSQYGAKAYADQGWTYQQVLHHYYTGVDVTDLYTLGLQ